MDRLNGHESYLQMLASKGGNEAKDFHHLAKIRENIPLQRKILKAQRAGVNVENELDKAINKIRKP